MTGIASPLVTIGIPTYNRANAYLKQTLRSAVNQTYKKIEIIVSDNCSSDNTEAVVKLFKDPRIRYIRQNQNIGANNNFNFCLNQAAGQYFLLLQDDDMIDKDFVESCIKAADFSTNAGIIRTGTRIVDASGSVINRRINVAKGLSTEDFFLAWFENKTAFFLCSTLYNTRRLKEIGGFHSNQNLFQDVIALVIIASKYGRVDIQEIKASFRKHHEEMTFSVNVMDWCKDSMQVLDTILNLSANKKETLRNRGRKFFANLNYRRASTIKPLMKRFLVFLAVFRVFNYRHLPPVRLILPGRVMNFFD